MNATERNPTERRQRFRRQLAGDTCIRPATVFDATSARIADSLGFEIGMLSGSVASATVLGAPDIAVITLTEFAALANRITRASDLSMLVDADHGYGNALSVMRTVRELEDAGVAALTIEDTLLPAPYGAGGADQLISVEEVGGKLRAALAARRDPQTAIIGRTGALRGEGVDAAVVRVRSFAEAGVDGVFIPGVRNDDEVKALHAASPLPVLLGNTPEAMGDALLAAHGVRIVLRGHTPFEAAVQAAYDALTHQAEGGMPSGLSGRLASAEVMAIATGTADYDQRHRDFMG